MRQNRWRKKTHKEIKISADNQQVERNVVLVRNEMAIRCHPTDDLKGSLADQVEAHSKHQLMCCFVVN